MPENRLIQIHGDFFTGNVDMSDHIQKIKNEAIKEFAERLKKYQYKASSSWSGITTTSKVVDVYVIDNLVKEMVGKDNAKL